jgi:23S rRNA C2498 (ribose-2'-O)-methylase RlmM
LQWNEDGVKTAKGNKVVPESEVTNSDVVLKAMGFRPSNIAERQDVRYAAQLQKTAGQTAKSRLAQKYARLVYEKRKLTAEGKDTSSVTQAMKEARKEVVSLAKSLKEGGAMIDDDWFTGFETSVKRQVENLVDPDYEYMKSKKIDFKAIENVYDPEDNLDASPFVGEDDTP